MKNKVLASTMAIGLAVISVAAFVGCKGEAESNANVSITEFSEVLKASYENYNKKWGTLETMEDWAMDVTLTSVDTSEEEYWIDGETEPIRITYTEEYTTEYDVSFAVKKVDDVYYFQMDTVANRWSKWRDGYDMTEDGQPVLSTYTEKEILQLVCGMDDGVYYMRAYSKANGTATTDGEEPETIDTEDKFYKTYTSKEEYLSDVLVVINSVRYTYMSGAYTLFQSESMLLTNAGTMDFWKTGDVYTAELNIVDPMVDNSLKEFAYSYIGIRSAYTQFGPKSLRVVNEASENEGKSKEVIEMEFLDEAILTVGENALDGYTENADLYYDDYICRLETGSHKK